MLTGSCLCGSVAYEVDGPPGPIVHCHCATCRKTHGSAFSTVTNVPRDRFRWRKGSLAFWDNRCTQHFAINDYPPETRVMHRVTIRGDAPF